MTTPDRRQLKTFILSMNVDHKILETEFSIAICRLNGDKWQLKTRFPAISDPRLSIVKSVFDCPLSFVMIGSIVEWTNTTSRLARVPSILKKV